MTSTDQPTTPDFGQLREMREAVETVIRTFQSNCPEGFDANTLAAAIVDACSDEMDRLYAIEKEHGEYQRLLINEGHLSEPWEGVDFSGCGAPMPMEA